MCQSGDELSSKLEPWDRVANGNGAHGGVWGRRDEKQAATYWSFFAPVEW